jgi:hypothetical protein
MVIITGQKPYGKCDVVPGLFYVATWFFHFDYLPLVPMGTRLILNQTGDTYRFIKLPFSPRSLLYAWSRAAFLLAGIIAWICTIAALNDQHAGNENDWIMPLLIAIFVTLAFLFVMLYPRRKLPPFARACQLAQIANLNDRGWAALNVLYGHDITDRPGDSSQTDILSLR